MTMDGLEPGRALILFDGVCNMCNASVRFVVARDSDDRFRFAPLQSDVGKEVMEAYGLRDDLSTFFLIDAGRVFEKSDAWMRIIRMLGWPWRILSWLAVIPRPVRDAVYDFIGRRRYEWFGKRDQCPAPDPRWRGKFLS